MSHFFVYILRNPRGKIYIGQTDNLTKRLGQHNDPENTLSKHTKRHPGPWQLIHAESFENRTGAMQREKELKSGKGREWIHSCLIPGLGGC